MSNTDSNSYQQQMCLICASPSSSNHPHPSGSGEELMGGETLTFFSAPGDEDFPIDNQLKGIFILSRVFKVPSEPIMKILTGSTHPETWFSVCLKCEQSIREYYEALKTIAKMERKMGRIQEELVGEMEMSRNVNVPSSMSVWEHIRNLILKGFSRESTTLGISYFSADENFVPESTNGHPPLDNLDSELGNDYQDMDGEVSGDWAVEDRDIRGNGYSAPLSPGGSQNENESETSDDKYYVCGQCSFEARDELELEAHIIDAHLEQDSESDCSSSEAVISRTTSHVIPTPPPVQTHNGESPQGDSHFGEDDQVVNENLSTVPLTNEMRTASGSQVDSVLTIKVKGLREKCTRNWLKCSKCPFRTVTGKLMEAHIPLHEEGSQGVPCPDCDIYISPEKLARHSAAAHPPFKFIQKMNKKIAQRQPAPVLQCTFCPHKTTVIATYKSHQKVHEEGSEATACNGCGIFLFPKSFAFHQFSCVCVIRESLGRDEHHVGSKGKMWKINASNPAFISFNRTLHKRKHYQCRQCPYETLILARVQVHVELHEEASQSVTCKECGWLLPLEQMETHQTVNHSAEELQRRPAPGKFECVVCTYECSANRRGVFDSHVKGHQQVEGATTCGDCSCYLSPRLLPYHRNKYCKARQNESCLETGVSAQVASTGTGSHLVE